MTYFGEADENLSKLARIFDMPRSTASDKFKRLMKNIKKDFFNSCAAEAIKFCEEHGIAYHIKDGTVTE